MSIARNRFANLARIPIYNPLVEKLLRRLTRQRSPGSFIGKLPPKHIDYPVPTLRTAESNGIRYTLDISDLVGWYTYWGFMDESRRRLYSLIREGDTVIDVGANLGEVALNAARIVGPNGSVYAFEPFPSNFRKLEINSGLNSFQNLHILRQGLGTCSRRVAMIAEEHNSGMNRIATDTCDAKGELIEIVELDAFVKAREIPRVDLIKIDVEGYEMNVLGGGLETIKTFRPKLFVEVIDTLLKAQGSSAKEVIELFRLLDYRLTDASTGIEIDAERLPAEFQYDVIAVPA